MRTFITTFLGLTLAVYIFIKSPTMLVDSYLRVMNSIVVIVKDY